MHRQEGTDRARALVGLHPLGAPSAGGSFLHTTSPQQLLLSYCTHDRKDAPSHPSDSLVGSCGSATVRVASSERLTVLALSFYSPLCLRVSNHSILTSTQSVWK